MVLVMRSKVIVWAYLIVLSLGTMLSLYMPKTEAAAKDSVVIPGDAIRLRILANSDLDSDQALKRKVRDAVNAQITLWVQDLTSMDKAKSVIKEKLPEIKAIAEKVVHDQGSNQTVKVQFGKVQFPTKLYGQFLYPAGKYQAVLITLGKGEGANWWCVLYPPLCFLDFSNGVAVSQGFNEKAEAATNHSDDQNKAAQQGKASSDDQLQKNATQQEEDSVQPDEKTTKDTTSDQESKTAKKQDHNSQKSSKTADQKNSKQSTKETVQQSADEKDTAVADDQLASTDQTKSDASIETAAKAHKIVEKAPVYTSEDEQPVKVKFFIVELWQKLFD